MMLTKVDPDSPEYKRFADLYTAARALRPSPTDRWRGDLYAVSGEGRWGAFDPEDGSFKLSKELVLDKLGPGASPQGQADALATVLHETNHARVPTDAAEEPNAVRSRHSKSLDEGLTEYVTVNDAVLFASSTGYGKLPRPKTEYLPAVHATQSLLEYAAGPDGVDALADRAIDQPVVMRWDTIADEIVRNRLSAVVPQDPQHQQAARAELVNAMAGPEWDQLHLQLPIVGIDAAHQTSRSLDAAVERIRDHYAQNPTEPYPAKIPNFELAQNQSLDDPQNRGRTTSPDLSRLPPPNPESRRSSPSLAPAHQIPSGSTSATSPSAAPAMTGSASAAQAPAPRSGSGPANDAMRFLDGQAPAAQATQRKPALGDGARGAGAGAGGAHRTVPGVGSSPTERDR